MLIRNGLTNTYTLGVGNRLESWDTQRENPGQGQGRGRGKGKGQALLRHRVSFVGQGNGGSHVQTRTSTIRHDDAGNVTRIHYKDETPARLLDIEWNERYQITAVYTNDALAETYGYDALGRRVWISDGTTTNYLIHDGQHVVAEVDASGSLQRSYTYGPSVDDILAMTDHTTTQTYYYVKDHLGSVVAIVDSTGTNVVETYEYDAYGQVTVYTNGTEVSESTVGNRYTFQGREISWKTGLYHFRARSYCPVIGRWLSRDKIGIAGGLDQYVFVGDNPVMLLDPLGLTVRHKKGFWGKTQELLDIFEFEASFGLQGSIKVGAMKLDIDLGTERSRFAGARGNKSTTKGFEFSLGIKDFFGFSFGDKAERCGHPEEPVDHPITHERLKGRTPRDYLRYTPYKSQAGLSILGMGKKTGEDVKLPVGAALLLGVEGALNLSEVYDFMESFRF